MGVAGEDYHQTKCAICHKWFNHEDVLVGLCDLQNTKEGCFEKINDAIRKAKYEIIIAEHENGEVLIDQTKKYGNCSGSLGGYKDSIEDIKQKIRTEIKNWISGHSMSGFVEMSDKNLFFASTKTEITKEWVLREYKQIRKSVHPPSKILLENGQVWTYNSPKTLEQFLGGDE